MSLDWTKQPDTEHDAAFFKALDTVEKFEGGYADDPADPGGATKWGVIQHTYDLARDVWGLPRRPVINMTDEECTNIYFVAYWLDARCDVLSWPFALAHFDTVVNMAPYWWKQCKNAAAGDWQDYLKKREWCYKQIVDKRPASLKFYPGWMHRVEVLRGICLKAVGG